MPENPIDVNTGQGIPGWVLRVEGRVMDVSRGQSWISADLQTGNVRLDKMKSRLSNFVRSAVIEFDGRQPPVFPEGNVVEVGLTR